MITIGLSLYWWNMLIMFLSGMVAMVCLILWVDKTFNDKE